MSCLLLVVIFGVYPALNTIFPPDYAIVSPSGTRAAAGRFLSSKKKEHPKTMARIRCYNIIYRTGFSSVTVFFHNWFD